MNMLFNISTDLNMLQRPRGGPIGGSWEGCGCDCENLKEHRLKSILRAVLGRDLQELQMLLSEEIPFDIDYSGKPRDKNKGLLGQYTPMQAAVYTNFIDAMKLLIEHDADVNSVVPEWGFYQLRGQSALSIALWDVRRRYPENETVDKVQMLLAAGAYASDVVFHINRYGRRVCVDLVPNLAILEMLFDSIPDDVLASITTEHVPGELHLEQPWSNEALELLRSHQLRRVLAMEEKNMTFALSLHPRSLRHGTIPSRLDKEIAWKIMELVCPQRPVNGRR